MSNNPFDIINFNIPPTPSSSWDTRLLNTPCDHLVKNEVVNFDISPVLKNVTYSGTGVNYNTNVYSGIFNPNASIFINTQLPLANDSVFKISQQAVSSFTNPVNEMLVIPNPITNFIQLQYPPLMNSLTANIQTIYLSTGQTTYTPYTNFTISNLQGIIQFNRVQDIGANVLVSYVARKRLIPQSAANFGTNYQFVGLNSSGQGIFKIFGNAFLSPNTNLYINYTTNINNCPKCAGAGFLNDLNIDSNGRVQMVYDLSKMIQDFFKRMLTLKGSNPFDLTDGTIIPNLVGMAVNNQSYLETTLKSELVTTIANIRNKQQLQAGYQTISPGEQIAQVNSVNIVALNATDISVSISVTSQSGQTQQIQQTVSGGN